MTSLKTRWFSRWEPAIAAAVRALPENGGCPPDLYLTLLEVNHAVGKGRTAVVERAGHPVAVIALEPNGVLRWKNFTNSVIPGFVAAASSADLLPALGALNVEVDASWWHRADAPDSSKVREHYRIPQYRLAVAERESYWRSHNMWSNLAKARNKCRELELAVNEPGDAEWVIRSSAKKWAPQWDASQEAALQASLEIARYLEPRGRHNVLTLRDHGRPVTGSTSIVHENVSISSRLFRDDEALGKLPTGLRVYDELFDFAERAGHVAVDLGGSYSYKSRWAPEYGARHDVVVGPAWTHNARMLARKVMKRAG